MPLPPLPVGVPPGHSYWNDWYEKLRLLINTTSFNHNDLLNIQGGISGEYYHLTSAQRTVVANTTGTNTGDQSLFSTIAVSGQSNVVAETTSDTLTLVAGTDVTITTDAGTDTITFSSTFNSSNLMAFAAAYG